MLGFGRTRFVGSVCGEQATATCAARRWLLVALVAVVFVAVSPRSADAALADLKVTIGSGKSYRFSQLPGQRTSFTVPGAGKMRITYMRSNYQKRCDGGFRFSFPGDAGAQLPGRTVAHKFTPEEVVGKPYEMMWVQQFDKSATGIKVEASLYAPALPTGGLPPMAWVYAGVTTLKVEWIGGGGAEPPKPPVTWPVTADGYPDLTSDWENTQGQQIKVVQGAGGKITAACTYTDSGRTIRWTMTGSINRSGQLVGKLRHTEGVPATARGYQQDRSAQLSSDGKTLSGKATFTGGGHGLTWKRMAGGGGTSAPKPPGKGTATPPGPGPGTSPGSGTTPVKEPASVGEMTIQAGRRTVQPGQTVTVPVWLIKASKLANINVSLRYDPTVVVVMGKVIKGNLLARTMFEANARDAGTIRLGFAQSSDMGGTGTLAQIRFRAVGEGGARTSLRLEVTMASSADTTKVRVATIDGEIVIAVKKDDVIPGDTNGDGKLTAVDAMNALKMSVGNLPVNLIADMDKDGKVTARDATIILRKAVGK